MISVLIAAAAVCQRPVPLAKPSVKSLNSQFVFTAADVAFNLDDASSSTTVLKLREEVEQIGVDLAELLDTLAAADDEITKSVGELQVTTKKLIVDVNTGMADFEKLSDARIAELKKSFEDGMDDVASAHEDGIAAMVNDINSKTISATTNMNTVNDKWEKDSKALEANINGKLATMQKDYVAKVAQVGSMSAAVKVKGDASKKALSLKKDAQQIIWIGGMRSHMYSGWRTMEFNRVELDAKGGHFSVHNSYFQVKKPGIYRLNLWTIQYGRGGSRYMVRINGGNMMNEGHQELAERYVNGRNWWRWFWEDMHIDQTWYFKANEKVEIRSYSPNYSLHGGSSRNSYNRVTFHFLGETKASLRV